MQENIIIKTMVSQDLAKVDYIRLECSSCKNAVELNNSAKDYMKCPLCKKPYQKEVLEIAEAIISNKYELDKKMADKISVISFEESK
jgi:predicted amidophosphoribosyltransferase